MLILSDQGYLRKLTIRRGGGGAPVPPPPPAISKTNYMMHVYFTS